MTNYIVCLAHFCELHGPSTIMCTQVTTQSRKQDHILPPTSKLQTCSSCKLILPDGLYNVVTTEEPSPSKSLKTGQDEEARVFISTHYPSSQKRYASLTKLVMKSLSVETSSVLSKPMFYGDMVNGYCINKIFKIRDINARGSERKYSLMVVADSESDLLSNWDVISVYFTEIIELVQERVELTFEDTMAKREAEASNNSNTLLDNERYLRRSMIKPKSLADLTNDDQIFVKLHLWAIELLKDILK
ncbi:protein required for amino acid permease transport from the Golgi to the cell surface [Scheffersomyces xylosifermentans]|uniref:protein required for amino acid permease transport from the Golgi to the cell surface n=1 Tax=Scheffersomyces xylosifermentans TaxID=1304137 RepID=UPI00315C5749